MSTSIRETAHPGKDARIDALQAAHAKEIAEIHAKHVIQMQELETNKAKQIIDVKQEIEQDKVALEEETRKIWAEQDEMVKKQWAIIMGHWAEELKSLKLARTEAERSVMGMEMGTPERDCLVYKIKYWEIQDRVSQLEKGHYEFASEMAEVRKLCIAKEKSLKLKILHDQNLFMVCEGVRIMDNHFRFVNDNIDILPPKDEFMQTFESMASQMHVQLQSLRDAISDLYALPHGIKKEYDDTKTQLDDADTRPDGTSPWWAIVKLHDLISRNMALVGTGTQAASANTQAAGNDDEKA
ncbi:hypothetical protein HBI47_237260 [Parastagonospora nodorum]|nr:hypothetical protein HBI47_237260 [Parastagonospora nodorum]